MKSLSAVKIVDRAILPSFIVVASKIGAIFLGSLIFQIPWTLTTNPGSYSFLFFQFYSQASLSTLVNFSDLVTILVCGAGFTWTIFQANHLNMDYSHPNIIAKFVREAKEFWLTTSGQVYHQAAVWLSLSWLVLFLIILNCYQNLTSSFVLGVALTVTLGLTFALYKFAKDS